MRLKKFLNEMFYFKFLGNSQALKGKKARIDDDHGITFELDGLFNRSHGRIQIRNF